MIRLFKVLKLLILRPSLWACLISIIAYNDDKALHGNYIYDDAGSVKNNIVVNGRVPTKEVFTRDFWGTEMKTPQSHKSYRPVTTLSFRLNYLYNEKYGLLDTKEETYGYHVVNVLMHGINTMLATEAAAFIFDSPTIADVEMNIIAQLVTGLLFGLHPVHAEAVSNITSRGELLMTFFFFLAFLSFASHIPNGNAYYRKHKRCIETENIGIGAIIFVYVVPWLCMTMSLFSKEQGATTLITLVFYDFLNNHNSIFEYVRHLLAIGGNEKSSSDDEKRYRQKQAINFVIRTIILAMQTLAICALRYYVNGETKPDFIFDQNPAAFSEDRFTRAFSVSWVYCLYVIDTLLPIYLCPDWSGTSIKLIEHVSDNRVIFVILMWCVAADCFWNLITGTSAGSSPPKTSEAIYNSKSNASSYNEDRRKYHDENRRVILMSFFAFICSPFVLSSNILVRVGLMKADRVIYLPLFGFCLLEALMLKSIINSTKGSGTYTVVSSEQKQQIAATTNETHMTANTKKKKSNNTSSVIYRLVYVIIVIQLGSFTAMVHERNWSWSEQIVLWVKAYNVNPVSHHTMYNCGYELSLKERYIEAEAVMRPIGDPKVNGPSNTFVYSMILYNLRMPKIAMQFINDALEEIKVKKKEGGIRNNIGALSSIECNLYVAKSYCTTDAKKEGKYLKKAVNLDPRSSYATGHLKKYIQKQRAAEMIEKQRRR